MKLTNKQEEEITYICGDYKPTQEEKEEYIQNTVHGGKNGGNKTGSWSEVGKIENNQIEIKKRLLDITIKMWRQDIASGLFFAEEYLEDYDKGSYIDKIIKSIMGNLPKDVEREGMFLTSSILWANDRYGLKIKLPDYALEDYRDMKIN